MEDGGWREGRGRKDVLGAQEGERRLRVGGSEIGGWFGVREDGMTTSLFHNPYRNISISISHSLSLYIYILIQESI